MRNQSQFVAALTSRASLLLPWLFLHYQLSWKSRFSSDLWEESRSWRRLILKEEFRKKPWSSRCLSLYKLRWISHWSSFFKLNMYYCSFCFVSFSFFEFVSSCLSAGVQSSVCARSELGEAVNQLLKLCISGKAMNQWMASCVAQLIASCEAQLVWLVFIQLNFVFKSCEKI